MGVPMRARALIVVKASLRSCRATLTMASTNKCYSPACQRTPGDMMFGSQAEGGGLRKKEAMRTTSAHWPLPHKPRAEPCCCSDPHFCAAGAICRLIHRMMQ